MTALPNNSVALVVTSPPYFAGKDYEVDGRGPASFGAYLDMLAAFATETYRVLEPGGRLAVNVAGLGRKPYVPLAALLWQVLHAAGLHARGEVVWRKAAGASGSCAWGSWRSAANPVLRDVSERVLVACKPPFARTPSVAARRAAGLPHRSTISRDDFMAATLDVWDIPAERAHRVGHPAPFPVELPRRLIELYTFADDLVVDPFMGSGTTGVAALGCGRRFAGWDLDPTYVALARQRLEPLLQAR